MFLFLLPLLAAAEVLASDATSPTPQQTCRCTVELSALLSSGILNAQGVTSLKLDAPGASGSVSNKADFQVRSFRSSQRIAVLIELPEGASLPGRDLLASLSAPRPQVLPTLQVLQVAPSTASKRARIIVEASTSAMEAGGIYTLELLDAEGTRFLILPEVRFPTL
ncbi:DUF2381 family protein [Corallococcus praedator]|uniref:DUF2381 family protein n=1 Tax=Corallococcus praedator TaxID=2316724 RepID=A0ABX9QCF5_9BACT|nr:DUF2381 family protein [Corallococcus sp. CA031C]RKI02161.1 DUF2381 family protein [Corallococcus praedator]